MFLDCFVMIAQIEAGSTLELKIEIESDSGEALVVGGWWLAVCLVACSFSFISHQMTFSPYLLIPNHKCRKGMRGITDLEM